MTQPNPDVPCYTLTPHPRHPNFTSLLPGAAPGCPGVPNLAEPARFEPDRAEYARVEVRYPAGVTYIVELGGTESDPIDGHLLFERQSFEVLTAATGRREAAPADQRADIALRGRVASALRTTGAAPVDRDARVRAQALRDFAESMRVLAEDAPADEPAKWPWSGYALAAVKAEEYAGKGFPLREDSTAGDSGTPEHPEPRTGEERCSYCKTKDRDECEEGTNAS
jgi:hypothetical protein